MSTPSSLSDTVEVPELPDEVQYVAVQWVDVHGASKAKIMPRAAYPGAGAGFAAFANHGQVLPPVLVRRVETTEGVVLYKAEPKPFGIQLVVGLSHPVAYHAPKGIKITVTNNVQLKIEGVDKELVGQVAAEIRNVRPPEPYKGKGIRYAGEQVRRKAGKTAQAAK